MAEVIQIALLVYYSYKLSLTIFSVMIRWKINFLLINVTVFCSHLYNL